MDKIFGIYRDLKLTKVSEVLEVCKTCFNTMRLKTKLQLKASGASRVWNQKWLFFTTHHFFKTKTGL